MNINSAPIPVENPKKKTNTVLIIVGVVAGICLILGVGIVLIIGSIGKLASKAFSTDPVVAAEAAHKIADYDLPPGYSEQMSMSLGSFQYVFIMPVDSPTNPIIALAQFGSSSNLSPEEMERQISQTYTQPGVSPTSQFHVVERRTITIRGVETEAVIREATMEGSSVMRQLAAVFPGKSGQAMLMIQGLIDGWDEAMITTFINSIR